MLRNRAHTYIASVDREHMRVVAQECCQAVAGSQMRLKHVNE